MVPLFHFETISNLQKCCKDRHNSLEDLIQVSLIVPTVWFLAKEPAQAQGSQWARPLSSLLEQVRSLPQTPVTPLCLQVTGRHFAAGPFTGGAALPS